MSQPPIQKLLSPSAMRLAMGELSQEELSVAQAAAQQALALMKVTHGWTVVPHSPSPGLLMSMAVRLDHGLGVPGHYDSVSDLYERLPGLRFSSQPTSHQARLDETLDLVRKIHGVLVSPAHRVGVGICVDDVVANVSAQHSRSRAPLAASAARYALTNLDRHGLALVPPVLTDDHLQSVVAVFSKQNPQGKSLGVERVWEADARRLHEEVTGRGFHRPGLPASPPSFKGSRPAR